jgi:hypothetical protein
MYSCEYVVSYHNVLNEDNIFICMNSLILKNLILDDSKTDMTVFITQSGSFTVLYSSSYCVIIV